MITVLAANDFGDDLGDGVAGPVGLLIIVLLVIALVFLMRSMNKHLRRVRDDFPDDETVARMRAEALSSGSSRSGGRTPRRGPRATDGQRRHPTTPRPTTTPRRPEPPTRAGGDNRAQARSDAGPSGTSNGCTHDSSQATNIRFRFTNRCVRRFALRVRIVYPFRIRRDRRGVR